MVDDEPLVCNLAIGERVASRNRTRPSLSYERNGITARVDSSVAKDPHELRTEGDLQLHIGRAGLLEYLRIPAGEEKMTDEVVAHSTASGW